MKGLAIAVAVLLPFLSVACSDDEGGTTGTTGGTATEFTVRYELSGTGDAGAALAIVSYIQADGSASSPESVTLPWSVQFSSTRTGAYSISGSVVASSGSLSAGILIDGASMTNATKESESGVAAVSVTYVKM
jgi:hypothetical protein